MSDWQPITTAPKDGTKILAYLERSNSIQVCQWHQIERDDDGMWRLTWDFHPTSSPTHWMPLPPPPQEGA